MQNAVIELRNVGQVFSRYDSLFARTAHRMGLGRAVENLVALHDVCLQVNRGETLGIVGESGCGKTTLGRIAAQLLSPSHGEVLYNATTLTDLCKSEARRIRTSVQMVFQNPSASLNPRRTVFQTVSEAMLAHKLTRRAELKEATTALLNRVGLPSGLAHRYPHELSGGQKQRVGIARALSVDPDCVVFDEAVAALDVSIQAQILQLLQKLRAEGCLTSLFISHDLNVVRHISDRVAILYLGRLVELAPTREIFSNAHHPYSKALLNEAPQLRTTKRIFSPIKGTLPSPLHPPLGCAFHPRCPMAMDLCRQKTPPLKTVRSGHLSACHLDSSSPD